MRPSGLELVTDRKADAQRLAAWQAAWLDFSGISLPSVAILWDRISLCCMQWEKIGAFEEII